jgi:hypothetical protein
MRIHQRTPQGPVGKQPPASQFANADCDEVMWQGRRRDPCCRRPSSWPDSAGSRRLVSRQDVVQVPLFMWSAWLCCGGPRGAGLSLLSAFSAGGVDNIIQSPSRNARRVSDRRYLPGLVPNGASRAIACSLRAGSACS